jgi:hypothetical protein
MGDHTSDSFAICGPYPSFVQVHSSHYQLQNLQLVAVSVLSCDCSEIEDEHLHQCNCNVQVT